MIALFISSDKFALESGEPGTPAPALFLKGGEEKSPYCPILAWMFE